MKNDKLTQLLKTHHTDAFRWASQCCNYQHEDAEEVLQMSYLKIASGKARFNERSTFKTWLFAVIRNTARDYLDKQVRFEQLDPLSQTPAEAIPEDRTNYRALLARLPERQQQVLLLVFYHGMTLQQVAETTNLHVGTVRTHYSRGKASLRVLIEKEKV
jgi:RNA polymerase sigma-70 factor (ECF subfamily)